MIAPIQAGSISRITSTLAPEQLKVSKMVTWLLNKIESGNMHAQAAKLVGGPTQLAQRVSAFISDRKVAKLKQIKL